MSPAVAYARPAVRPERVEPQLAPVAAPQQRPGTTRRPRATYAFVIVASLAGILCAQLLLSIVVSDGAYQITALQAQQKELMRQENALSERLDLLGSTQHLAANAANLGMVPGASPLFLDVSSGGIAAAPGTVDPAGCGGACNLVGNSLLTGMPLVSPQAPQTTLDSQQAAPTVGATTEVQQEQPTDALPAPVTH
ncbi:hypothetical protein M2152_000995 [Microbacteriaceae bacterium SG_E_30_P1]|uniref:Cell division protein FtsL n=1 Tax=Antiquaquibacter oligotrophicus TaxID=2880260 RepID=A0ABT6KLC6_9MICO|nr:hypothetical protein [Antiquaquibacter oligotrophicus]MDH6180813.1 hypothetical protein [Antiquaquibacter oligotrophicus]UDF13470.1 hypothetical protein LH407_01010 [Antiquaquibacter oligotrophicus]